MPPPTYKILQPKSRGGGGMSKETSPPSLSVCPSRLGFHPPPSSLPTARGGGQDFSDRRDPPPGAYKVSPPLPLL